MTQDELLIKLFDEVGLRMAALVGFPCLVTPFSQANGEEPGDDERDCQLEKGKERWGMIADDIWDMLLGKAGTTAGHAGS